MLDITIIIITGVMMREFPLEESLCVRVLMYVCVCVYLCRRCKQRWERYLYDDSGGLDWIIMQAGPAKSFSHFSVSSMALLLLPWFCFPSSLIVLFYRKYCCFALHKNKDWLTHYTQSKLWEENLWPLSSLLPDQTIKIQIKQLDLVHRFVFSACTYVCNLKNFSAVYRSTWGCNELKCTLALTVTIAEDCSSVEVHSES